MRDLKKIGVAVLAFGAGQAMAAGTAVTANVIEVTVKTGTVTGTYVHAFPASAIGGVLDWSPADAVVVMDSATGQVPLAVLNGLSVRFDTNAASVELGFDVNNVSQSTGTDFTIQTGTVQIDPLSGGEGTSEATVTILNEAGSTYGVSLSGLFSTSKAYRCTYSTSSASHTGTMFSSLVQSFGNANGATVLQRTPATGYAPVTSTVHMLSSEFKFRLSAGDRAYGSGTFTVVRPAGLVSLTDAALSIAHSGGSEFARAVPLSGTTAVESRRCPRPTVVLGFDGAVYGAGGGNVGCSDVALSSGTCQSVTGTGSSTLEIALANVSQNTTLTAAVSGLENAAGDPLQGGSSVSVRMLPGDCDGDGMIDTADLNAIKSQLWRAVTPNNYWFDVNLDGVVNVIDLLDAKQNLFAQLP